MYINHVAETEDGEVVFQGNLSGPELAMVLEVGLNYLLQQGALPFVTDDSNKVDPNLIHDVHPTEQ